MKPVMSFSEFRSNLHESHKVDEGLKDVIGKIGTAIKAGLQKIGEFFFGKGANFLNLLIAQDKGELPKGMKVYPTKEDVELIKKAGMKVKVPAIRENEGHTFHDFFMLTEDVVKLEHPNPNVENVGVKEFKEFVRDSVEGGTDINPLLIWGAPGIGKTAIIEDIAKEYHGPKAKQERRIIDYDLMTMAPEDFFLPTVQGKTETGDVGPETRAVRVPDKPLPLYKIDDPDGDEKTNGPDGKGGILFFDEIARCSSAVQNVCLKLINERRIGDWVLGSKWVMVAAANREGDDETGTYKFSSTLGNRFRQINYAPKFEDWNEWASNAIDEEGDFIVSKEILAFVRFNHDKYFYNLDPEVKAATGGSNTIFASPRAWTNASKALKVREKRALKSGERMTDTDRESIVASQVGKDAAAAFMGFLKLMKKIDINEIKAVYENPAKAPKFDSLQMDEKNALIASVVFFKSKDKVSEKEMDNFVDWLISIKDAPFAIKAMAMFQEVHPYLKEDLKKGYPGNEHWEEVCKAKLFDAYPALTKGR